MDIVPSIRRSLERLIGEIAGAGEIEIALEVPPEPRLGDLATPVCFELARRLRRAPRAIAEDLAGRIAASPLPGVARAEVAGGGYLNLFLDRNAFLGGLAAGLLAPASPGREPGKIIVEHTNINPNKAAHIGHMRNAVLGDSLVRCLRFLARDVEVQNYIDDTGVQVADLVVGFREIERLDLDGIRRLAAGCDAAEASGGAPFDAVCWDLYARVAAFYEASESNLKHRSSVLRALEERRGAEAEMAAFLAGRMVRHHLRTMDRIGVRYDLLPRESDILEAHFWSLAFERLRDTGAIFLCDEGKHAGCWVMDLEGSGEARGEDRKIIVRSDGTVTYVGKDIAYQMWKFGLLGRDFSYRPVDWEGFPWSGYPLWQTGTGPGPAGHPPFGGAQRVYNVIDTRQSYLQRVVRQGLLALGHVREAEESVHFSYEMVALSPASISLLFPDHPLTGEDRGRPYLEMSGRKGLGVMADALIDSLLERARGEVDRRHEDLPAGQRAETASRIAVAALRYYMLRFTRNRVVAFDIDDALSFEGETGPYCQYAVVRAGNILNRIRERDGPEAAGAARLVETADFSCLGEEEALEHWALATEMSRLPETVAAAVAALELSTLARFCHRLAQSFNSFYHRYPVMQEEDPAKRALRTVLVDLFIRTQRLGLGLLGIEVPDRM